MKILCREKIIYTVIMETLDMHDIMWVGVLYDVLHQFLEYSG